MLLYSDWPWCMLTGKTHTPYGCATIESRSSMFWYLTGLWSLQVPFPCIEHMIDYVRRENKGPWARYCIRTGHNFAPLTSKQCETDGFSTPQAQCLRTSHKIGLEVGRIMWKTQSDWPNCIHNFWLLLLLLLVIYPWLRVHTMAYFRHELGDPC